MKTQISMRLQDGRVASINETIRNLGNECIDLLPMHALTGMIRCVSGENHRSQSTSEDESELGTDV